MIKTPISAWIHTLKAYERHISAAAVAGGFAFDSFTYGRVDHPVTQTLLIVYLGVAALSIVTVHWLEAHQEWVGWAVVKLRGLLPALTQFMLGSLWSAFLVFYARSGVLAASWPFLVVLIAILIGNEVFRKYYARLVFTTTLFFFALISYAAFMVPVFTHTIGQVTFIGSGLAAVAVFAGFLWLLTKMSVAQLGEVKWKIAFGASAVYAAINGLYFLDVLPPLPLALQNSGVYHSLCRVPPAGRIKCVGEKAAKLDRHKRLYYRGLEEPRSWGSWFGVSPVVHLESGDRVVVFGAVFAPIRLETMTYHVWQHYDEASGTWKTVQSVDNYLRGGREKGYRSFSYKLSPAPGKWRVDFRSIDGRLIGRTAFTVESGSAPSLSPVILN